MGIAMSRNALIKRVYNVSKNSPHGVVGVEVTVEDDGTDDMAGLTPDTGVSSGSESKKYTGRPKGSTDDKKREDEKKRVECINAICDSYSTETIKRSAVKSRVPAGFLAGLIMSKQEEYGISEYISEETIRSRHKQGRLHPTHPGTASPVASAEMALVEICIQMGRIRQPLTGPQGVKVFNDLISGTPLQ